MCVACACVAANVPTAIRDRDWMCLSSPLVESVGAENSVSCRHPECVTSMTYACVLCDHSAAPPIQPECKRLCADVNGKALLSLYQTSLVELREKYIFKGGEVWTLPASGRRILIREHDERLFALMCHDMNLGRVGSKLPSARSKALLAGTPGMGKSTFMWVAAITFMKMVKADPSVEHVQHVDLLQRNGRTKLKVAVFNPHVSGLRLRWTKLAGAEMVYLGQEPNSMSCVRTVRLFDAGANWTQLPCTEALVYAFATSPADPRYYDRWMMKDAIQPRYVMPWTWGEIKALARLVGKPELECFQQFELIGGNPRGVFDYSMAELTATVKRRTTSLAACDFDKLDQMLCVNDSHSGSHTPTFSLVQLWPRHWADTSNGFGDYREYSVRATRAAWHVSITPHDCAGVCQVRFASPSIYQRYVSTNYAAKTAQIAKAIHMGLHSELPGVGDQFEDFAHSVVPRQGFAERDILFMERCCVSNDMTTVKLRSASAPANQPIIYFVDEDDLRRKVEHAGAGVGYFVPYSCAQGVVDAFGWLSIDGRMRLAGYKMTVSNRHPISRRELAQVERLAAIIRGGPPDDALPVNSTCKLALHPVWLSCVFVLTSFVHMVCRMCFCGLCQRSW